MNEKGDNRKICKMCFEEICQHWQHPLLTFGYSPISVVIPICLFLILFGWMFSQLFYQGEAFQGHESELIVKDSEP